MKLGTLCFIKNQGKTLMLHRVKKENDMHQGKWVGLGGKVNSGETPEECIIREVKEECGLTIKKPFLKGVLTFSGVSEEDDWYLYVFTADNFEGKIIDSKEGVLEWIKDSELFNLDLWEGDKIFIKWLNKQGFFSGKFIYKSDKLTEHSVIFYNS